MSVLRSVETQKKYDAWRNAHADDVSCVLCDRSPKENFGTLWKIIPNDFPYDAIAWKSDLLVPMRHFPNKNDMSPDEHAALTDILDTLNDTPTPPYDVLMENFSHGRTEKGHYHLHLCSLKNHTISDMDNSLSLS